MTTEKYRVAYHLSQVVYFEGNDSLPAGSAYGKLWAGLGRLGDRRTLAQFSHSQSPLKSKLRRMRLGMSAPLIRFWTRMIRPSAEAVLSGEILDHDAEQNMLWLHNRLCECDAVIGS